MIGTPDLTVPGTISSTIEQQQAWLFVLNYHDKHGMGVLGTVRKIVAFSTLPRGKAEWEKALTIIEKDCAKDAPAHHIYTVTAFYALPGEST